MKSTIPVTMQVEYPKRFISRAIALLFNWKYFGGLKSDEKYDISPELTRINVCHPEACTSSARRQQLCIKPTGFLVLYRYLVRISKYVSK